MRGVKRPVIVITVVAALGAATVQAWSDVRQARAFRRLLAEGDAALGRGETSAAIEAFSGAVALGLVDRGVLSLDDTIGARLPNLPAAWGAVTLRQLLQHTSGVPSFTTLEFFQYFAQHPHGPFTHQMLIEFVADQPLGFPPGSAFSYSNTDNVVIALMAEAATSKPYEQLLSELVLDPSTSNAPRCRAASTCRSRGSTATRPTRWRTSRSAAR